MVVNGIEISRVCLSSVCWGEVKPRLSRPNSSAHVILIVSSRFLKPDAGHKLIHEHCVKSEWLTGNVELLRLPERPEGVAEGELFDHGHPEEIFFGEGKSFQLRTNKYSKYKNKSSAKSFNVVIYFLKFQGYLDF